MIQIDLKIQGKKTETHRFEIKSCWSEVTTPELIALTPILFPEFDDLTEDFMRQRALYSITSLEDDAKIKVFESLAHANPDEPSIKDLYPLTDWLFEPVQFAKSIFPTHQSFQGPRDEFNLMRLEQYGFADAWYNAYTEHRDTEYLDKLCACLYLPKGKPWNKAHIERHLPVIAKLDLNVKRAMLLNYMGLRNHFVTLYPGIFSKPPTDDEKEALNYEEPEYNPKWFYELMVNLPAEQFGTMEQKAMLYVDDVFDYLEFKKHEKLQ